jgi:peptide/nickel transport system ATP-binding protein
MQTASPPAPDAVLSLRALKKHFAIRNAWGHRTGWLKAVDGVSFDVRHGEILGLVGESGCGKSSLGKTLMGIFAPTAGEIWLGQREIGRLSGKARRAVGREMQYVYQDPGASLDPRWKVSYSLHEPLVIHTGLGRRERESRVEEMLRAVGLPDAHLDLYPHELSGGQQRRVALARILTLQPRLMILDEPTSGLDVSVQATILKLFRELQQTFQLAYLFMSHDLAVVRMMCHRVAVMYLGRIAEFGETARLFDAPRHPYTRSLLAAIPRIGGERITDRAWLQGEPPNPGNLPSGCRFRTRCPLAEPRCAESEPELREVDGRLVACHLV